MSPELTALLGQLGIAAIFVIAWFRSENLRDKERESAQKRHDELISEYHAAQDAHRREVIALLTMGRSGAEAIILPHNPQISQ